MASRKVLKGRIESRLETLREEVDQIEDVVDGKDVNQSFARASAPTMIRGARQTATSIRRFIVQFRNAGETDPNQRVPEYTKQVGDLEVEINELEDLYERVIKPRRRGASGTSVLVEVAGSYQTGKVLGRKKGKLMVQLDEPDQDGNNVVIVDKGRIRVGGDTMKEGKMYPPITILSFKRRLAGKARKAAPTFTVETTKAGFKKMTLDGVEFRLRPMLSRDFPQNEVYSLGWKENKTYMPPSVSTSRASEFYEIANSPTGDLVYINHATKMLYVIRGRQVVERVQLNDLERLKLASGKNVTASRFFSEEV